MKQTRVLTASMLALMNVSAICNIKNFPVLAEYGFSIIVCLIFASIGFLIPVALVAAELATGWPDRGIYTWVKEGLGPRWGFLAIWLQWIENVVWYPTILSFIAATFSYFFNPALAQNKLYVMGTILGTFWAFTFLNFLGMKISGWISSLSAVFGTILPIALILLFGAMWMGSGHPVQISFSWDTFFPDFSSVNQLVLLTGVFFGVAGLEMTAVHAKDVKNPRVDYPRAILLSCVLIILLSALGSLAISAIVPLKEIQLTSGGMAAFSYLFNAFGMPWAVSAIAVVMTIGGLGMLSTWIVGPSRGLLATAQDGDLPPLFHRMNKAKMPVAILIIQAIIVSILSLVFLYMPSVNSSYWVLMAMAANLYMLMYILMFIAAIRLRYKHPNVFRAYRLGKKGNRLMWIVASIGAMGSLFSMTVGILPPSQLDTGSVSYYELTMLAGMAVFCIIPNLIFNAKKASWRQSAPSEDA